MRLFLAVSLSAVLLSIPACTSHSPSFAEGWNRVEADGGPEGMVAFWVHYEDREEPAVFDSDYGMLLVWSEEERAFYLFHKPSKSCFATKDFDAYLRQISRLPKGISFQWIDTCGASCSWKMPQSARNRLDAALKEGRHTLDISSTTCICESRKLRYIRIETDCAAESDPPYVHRELTEEEYAAVEAVVVRAEKAEEQGDDVKAYRLYVEACELENSFHDGHGERCPSPYALFRFMDRVARNKDGALQSILYSADVPKESKHDLLRFVADYVDDEVEVMQDR